MNTGMWVAYCPRPGCTNAEKFGLCDDGTTGGLAGDSFRCRPEYGGCGLVCRAQWPDADLVPKIEALVLVRPVPATRNWEPGETLSDLMGENFEHGIVPAAALRGEPVTILGDRVTSGALESTHRIEIEG
jgi:hypothetical protein